MASPQVPDSAFSVEGYLSRVAHIEPAPVAGRVVRVVGLLVESAGPTASVGDICRVRTGRGPSLSVEVVGFRDGRLLSVPLGDTAGVRPGDAIFSTGSSQTVPVGPELLGRVIDGFGQPIDGRGAINARALAPLHPPNLNPLDREPVTHALATGVRAIDGILTCGRGQRIGVFGGSGVGKSTLLGMMARGTEAEVVVLCLVGERGREVRTFLEHDLGPQGLERSVVVVSTSDSPPLARQRAAYAATAIAEAFRDEGRHVLLMMDSVTRFAMAQREVGLAAGEPPTARGYPPSVFARLPGLLERAGSLRGRGSITAFYTVLVEGDDHNEPVADSVRAILDGHIVLSRDLAARNHYPAIDILHSVSRTMPDVTSPEHRLRAGAVRDWLATIRDNEDLVSVGAYAPGSNPRIDAAFARRDAMTSFLCQSADTGGRLADAIDALNALYMADFRFRAEAALDVRRQEENAAATALGRAEAQFSEVQAALDAAIRGRARAQTDALERTRAGADIATIGWHRNWITRWSATVERQRRELETRAQVVRDAQQAWRNARRRRLALERMRERAWRRFRYEQHRLDIKAMDELARLRHVAGMFGEMNRDD